VRAPSDASGRDGRAMSYLIVLVPIAILLGLLGLAAFLWSLHNGQYEDLDGAAERILLDDGDKPVRDKHASLNALNDQSDRRSRGEPS
jgi:cbb3-type cytochrome oxidase maturation protein